MKRSDILIIGSGVAALQLAKRLRQDMHVMIITKSTSVTGNSYMAQGGVAAALGENDDIYKHASDTLEAGRYHNDSNAVLKMTEAAPHLIQELVKEGCAFDLDNHGNLLLGMEGAHSEKRIVHGGGDATGKRIIDFFLESQNENVEIVENVFVFELLMDKSQNRCIGVKGKLQDGRIEMYTASHIIIATGGCGQIFSFTSNADTVIGDGIALAYRAGANITDMEFVQFHPTLLYVDGKAVGLVSEAVRGEGAKLVTLDGTLIMEDIHPMKDLAPRHIVSQTIYEYIKHDKQVFLNISMIKNFQKRFPTITTLCENNGIDLKEGLIPVVPGSHFLMGGIETDLLGRTNIHGLYAIGEAACTGIHGANRLASNSLLEGLFFGNNLAQYINTQFYMKEKMHWKPSINNNLLESPVQLPSIEMIKKTMMDRTGIVRTKEGLASQIDWLNSYNIKNLINSNYDSLSIEELIKIFMLITSSLITSSALQRTESRGGHFRADFPLEDDTHWLRRRINHISMNTKDEINEQIKASTTN